MSPVQPPPPPMEGGATSASSANGPLDVVCLGQGNWRDTWTGKQALMSRLARRGHRILYVDPKPAVAPPQDRARALRPVRHGYGLEEVAPRLHVLTQHRVPWLRRLNRWRWPWTVRGTVRALGMVDPVVIALRPFAEPIVRVLDPDTFIYYAVDEHTGFGKTPEQRRRRRKAEDALLQRSDLALAVSNRLYRRFRETRPETELLTNGADVETFAPAALTRAEPHPALAGMKGPIIGFIGSVDQRLDLGLLLAVARARPEWNLVLAGPVKDGVDATELSEQANVHLLGYQEHHQLPGIMRELDVGMVPYRLTPLTLSCDPLKVYEYLSAGLPVVATDLDGLDWCRDVIDVVRSPDDFVQAVAAALTEGPAAGHQRLSRARANTWEDRTTRLESLMRRAVVLSRQRRRRSSDHPSTAVLRGRPPVGLVRELEDRVANATGFRGRVVRRFRDRACSPRLRALHAVTRPAGWAYYGLRVLGRLLTNKRPLAVRKILLPRSGRLGDQILYVPMLRAVRRAYPDAHITLALRPGAPLARLLPSMPYADEVRFLSAPEKGGLAKLLHYVRVFASGYDLVISGGAFSLMREAMLSGAPRLWGLWDGHPLQALNTTLFPVDQSRHEAENNLLIAEALGADLPLRDRAPVLAPAGPTSRAVAVGHDRAALPPEGTPFVILHPGASKKSRRWPARHFATLAVRLLQRDPDLRIALTGVAKEGALSGAVLDRIPPSLRSRVHDLIGKTTLAELESLMQCCELMVCNDTGTMHLARARGVPLLALLGPENPHRWGPHPWGLAPATALRHAVPCAPCKRFDCELQVCMEALGPGEALEEALRILATRSRPVGSGPGPTLQRVDRTRSWSDLHRAGLTIPRVAGVLFSAGPDHGIGPARAEWETGLWAARQSTLGQDAYPELDLLIATAHERLRQPRKGPDIHRGGTRLGSLHLPASYDARQAWSAVLERVDADFVIPIECRDAWRGRAVGEQVATLMREPRVPFAYLPPAGPGPAGGDDRRPFTLFRRSALLERLETAPLSDPREDVADRAGPWPFDMPISGGVRIPEPPPLPVSPARPERRDPVPARPRVGRAGLALPVIRRA